MKESINLLSGIDFIAILPEMFLASMLVAILLLECFTKRIEMKVIYSLSIVALIGAAVLALVTQSSLPVADAATYYWYEEIVHTSVTTLLKVMILVIVLFGLVYSYPKLDNDNLNRTEYYLLILLGSLGMMVLVSAASLLMVYLGLELMSLPMYALVAFNRQSTKGSEAAMKYFVMGAMASGILLYGMALLYGATGSLNLDEISVALVQIANTDTDIANNKLLVFSIVFIVVGVAFKLGAAPFHSWVPDVYEGAPISIALYVSAAPKIAAIAMAVILLRVGSYNIADQWQMMLSMIAVVSFLLGNLIALKQTNIRRMLGYSAVSHAGFMMLGIFVGNVEAANFSGYYYAITYALTTLAAFGFIMSLSNKGEPVEEIITLKGFAKDHAWYALLMSCVMLSMAGIPFFVGFYAKLFVLKNAFEAGYWPVVVIGLIASVIGLFYYLRIIKVMFFDETDAHVNVVVDAPLSNKIILNINVLMVAFLGIFSTLLIRFL